MPDTVHRHLKIAPLVVAIAIQSIVLPPAYSFQHSSPDDDLSPKSNAIPHLMQVMSTSDFASDSLSAEAKQLAQLLKITEPLQRLQQMRDQSSSRKLTTEERLDILELREDLSEKLDQTGMEIEYVRASLYAEEAIHQHQVRAYTQQRDDRVNASNVWSFRTNGVLWTICEALSIPTYSHPRYSVSAGTFGILAGLVPTAFSMFALRESKGGKFQHKAVPNMLAKIFGYTVGPTVDYPESVWDFLHSPPVQRTDGKTRISIMIDNWVEDKNIHILTDKNSKSQLDMLTGSVEQRLSIDLLSDRVAMLSQLDAVVGLMNRPLLELMIAVRGKKRIAL